MTPRRRVQLAFIGAWALVTATTALAVITRNMAALLVALAVLGATIAALAVFGTRARRRLEYYRPPYLAHLDAEQVRLVTATAERGGRAPDPVLAEAVVAHARHQRTGHVLLLVSNTLLVGLRMSHLLAGHAGAGAVLDLALIAFWLVAAVFLVRALQRAQRAIDVNRLGPA